MKDFENTIVYACKYYLRVTESSYFKNDGKKRAEKLISYIRHGGYGKNYGPQIAYLLQNIMTNSKWLKYFIVEQIKAHESLKAEDASTAYIHSGINQYIALCQYSSIKLKKPRYKPRFI
ncbi:MAG: hypothetical protein GY710_04440 [Desulfobacteraceae bacterium]|nr:hypothetical protein [Desulfobacteraceae bacterium]